MLGDRLSAWPSMGSGLLSLVPPQPPDPQSGRRRGGTGETLGPQQSQPAETTVVPSCRVGSERDLPLGKSVINGWDCDSVPFALKVHETGE